jgi:hypothetical protein
LLIAAASLLPLAGCQRDAIETHRVEIPEPPEPKVRLLGAMLPHDHDMWFFKVAGKLDAIEPLKAVFEDFVRSVRFGKPGEPISWTLPEGWKKLPEAKEQQRYATLRAGANDDAPELTVHRFPAEGKMADVRDNVIRWGPREVGVKVPLDEWKQYTHPDRTAAGDLPITFVDMRGPGPKAGVAMPPFAGGGQENPHARPEKISYTAPEGWKEADRVVERGGIRVEYDAAWKVEKDGHTADITISKFPGGSGGLLPNVNRWRTAQLGLPPLQEDQLKDAMKAVKLGNAEGQAVDFTGPGNQPGKGERRILAAIVSRPGATWYIKMDGPADLVGGQKAAFDKFLGSVTFDGGNGG